MASLRSAPRAAFFAGLVVLVVGLASATPGGNQAQPRAPATTVGITVFEHINYGGRWASFARDVPDLRPSGMDRIISSFIIAPGEVWEVCTGRNYTGRCQTFSGREPDLVRRNFNDMISSLRSIRGGSRPPAPPPPTSFRLELFAGTRYSGQRFVLTAANPNFARSGGFNDRAMSARVGRNQEWEVCINANYDQCSVIDSDVPDLATIGLSRLISSARPRVPSRGRGRE